MTPTILLVVEHDFLRETLTMWLARTFPEYHIKAVGTVSEGISLAWRDPPQLIVLDAGWPEAKSLDAIKDIKHALVTTPILVLISYESEIHRRHALGHGATACFRKDAMLTALQPTITELLGLAADSNGHHQKSPVERIAGQKLLL